MLFQCGECKKTFHYPAKQTIPTLNGGLTPITTYMHPADNVITSQIETSVCPFCYSKTFTEEKEADVANVLVVELTTGPQIAIDKALAEGYKVVGRYAKQYILEKPKENQP
jgi:hypothetical protein